MSAALAPTAARAARLAHVRALLAARALPALPARPRGRYPAPSHSCWPGPPPLAPRPAATEPRPGADMPTPRPAPEIRPAALAADAEAARGRPSFERLGDEDAPPARLLVVAVLVRAVVVLAALVLAGALAYAYTHGPDMRASWDAARPVLVALVVPALVLVGYIAGGGPR